MVHFAFIHCTCMNTIWKELNLLCFCRKLYLPYLRSVFVDIVRTIFVVLSSVTDERDQVAITERRMLQRSYFSFIATLLNNDVAEVLSTQGKSSVMAPL